MPDRERGHDEEKLEHTGLDITVAIFVFFIALALLGAYVGGILNWYRSILDWFYSHNWVALIQILKIIFIILDIGLIVILIYILKKYSELDTAEPTPVPKVHEVLPETEVTKNWSHIRELANSKNPSDWNMAIIRADALLDDILQHQGYLGETLAERLKIVDPTKLKSVDSVWSAHRLRNSIAHDPLEQHTKETIITTLRAYAQGLKELGVMEENQEPSVPEEKK